MSGCYIHIYKLRHVIPGMRLSIVWLTVIAPPRVSVAPPRVSVLLPLHHDAGAANVRPGTPADANALGVKAEALSVEYSNGRNTVCPKAVGWMMGVISSTKVTDR